MKYFSILLLFIKYIPLLGIGFFCIAYSFTSHATYKRTKNNKATGPKNTTYRNNNKRNKGFISNAKKIHLHDLDKDQKKLLNKEQKEAINIQRNKEQININNVQIPYQKQLIQAAVLLNEVVTSIAITQTDNHEKLHKAFDIIKKFINQDYNDISVGEIPLNKPQNIKRAYSLFDQLIKQIQSHNTKVVITKNPTIYKIYALLNMAIKERYNNYKMQLTKNNKAKELENKANNLQSCQDAF